MTTPLPSAANGAAPTALQVLQLGKDMARLQAQLDDLTGIGDQVTDLADNVAAMREQLQALLPAEEQAPRMWEWSAMNREEAAVAWQTLVEWVRDVLSGTYAAVGSTGGRNERIPGCWYLHPDAVAELGWLCQEWHRIYRSSKGTPAGAGDWHDRWLPGVIHRLQKVATTMKCKGTHVDARPSAPYDDADKLRAVVEADINDRPAASPT